MGALTVGLACGNDTDVVDSGDLTRCLRDAGHEVRDRRERPIPGLKPHFEQVTVPLDGAVSAVLYVFESPALAAGALKPLRSYARQYGGYGDSDDVKQRGKVVIRYLELPGQGEARSVEQCLSS